MRCSSCKAHLDQYVDGLLAPRERAQVARHLADCSDCRELYDEFRSIDALLLTPRTLEPAPNFRFRVMAEIGALPVPHRRRLPLAAVLAAYVAFGWAAIAGYLALRGLPAQALFAWTHGALGGASGLVATLAAMSERIFGRSTGEVSLALGVFLAADLAIAAAIAATLVARSRLRATEIER
ncbi:MAG: anti-sigma factor family protein [Vulcanimicrobiaceae bacterium]